MQLKKMLFVFFAMLVISLPVLNTSAFAEDEEPWIEPSKVVTKENRTEEGWQITYIRGEAARLIFEGLDPSLERDVTRKDASVYKARSAATMTCTFSTKFLNHARHLCAFALKPDGTTVEVTADPEFNGTASIGGSN